MTTTHSTGSGQAPTPRTMSKEEADLRKRIAQLEEALKFYANKENYRFTEAAKEINGNSDWDDTIVAYDRGKKARTAIGDKREAE